MGTKKILIGILVIGLWSCNAHKKKAIEEQTNAHVHVVGAMKNVMWKGELGASIHLDTIANKKGLYGLGPKSELTGELLVNNGVSYLSKVASDSTMTVEKVTEVSAPFFVYANVNQWTEIELGSDIQTIQNLEKFINSKTKESKRPFAFKLMGKVAKAKIHIQNLPAGTKVASPKEAHQEQIDYELKNEEVEIVGFFSTEHKGVFTHHDSNVHMHLITKDETKMGHLDELEIENMRLYLPKN
jgi:acetolactate decarboxylase